MWMLLGLVGILVASSMVDVFVPAEGAEDIDDSETGGTADMTEASGSDGDLMLDAAMPDAGDAPAAEPDDSPQDNFEDGLPFHHASGDGATGDGWYNEEFLSTDAPPQDPTDYFIDAGDDGAQAAGGDGNDTLVGGAGDDWLDGQDGADDIVGGAGDDTQMGGRGADTLVGGAGNDSLVSGAGNGLLVGGAGDDVLVGGEDDDGLFGGAGDDTLQGGWGDDVLVAGAGADQLFGGAGDDTIFGFTPDDSGQDIDGADVINAGDGDDIMVLGSGDIAHGGGGGDSFILGGWIDPDEPALISDFATDEDTLRIAYNANGPVPEVSALYDEGAGGMQILLDGELVAVLQGVHIFDTAAIALQPVEGGGSG